MTHVPYRGAGPAMTDLLGGQVDMIFGTAAAVSNFVDSGKLRALGVTTPQRSPAFKDVPTIAETVPGYAVESWYGLYAPAGTPAGRDRRSSTPPRRRPRTTPTSRRRSSTKAWSSAPATRPNSTTTSGPKRRAGGRSSRKTTSRPTDPSTPTQGDNHELHPDRPEGRSRDRDAHPQPPGQAQRDERRHAHRVHRRAGARRRRQGDPRPGAHRRRQGLLRRRRHLRHAAAHECAGRRGRLQRLAPPAARAPHAGAAAHHAQAGDRRGQRRRLRPGCRHRAGLRLHHRQRMGQLHLVATSTAASSPTAAACTSCRAASACPRPRS